MDPAGEAKAKGKALSKKRMRELAAREIDEGAEPPRDKNSKAKVDSPGKAPEANVIKAMMDSKKNYSKFLGEAQRILENINIAKETDKNWGWAKNQTGPLNAAVEKLTNADKGTIGRDLMSSKDATFKKKYNESDPQFKVLANIYSYRIK